MSTSAALLLKYKYTEQLYLQAQQMQGQLRSGVSLGLTDGEKTRHQLIGKVTPIKRTSRHQDTVYTPTPGDDRWSVTEDYLNAELYDHFDKVRSTVDDVNSKYAKAQVAGMNRTEDKIILSALGGTAVTGQTGTGTQALPSDQKIAVSAHVFDEAEGSGNAGLTYYKVLDALNTLEEQWGSVEGQVHGCFFAREKNTLIATTKTSSSYYIPEQLKPFATGMIKQLLGVTWHLLAEDNIRTDGSSNRLMYLWLPESLALDVNADINTRIDELPMKNYTWQIWTEMMMGAVRRDDKGVVEIACHPTTLF